MSDDSFFDDLQRTRTNSKTGNDQGARLDKSNISLSVSETPPSPSTPSGSHTTSPAGSPMSPTHSGEPKKKGRTLFSLGRKKTKDLENTNEKEDKKSEAEGDEKEQQHHNTTTTNKEKGHHAKEKEKEKEKGKEHTAKEKESAAKERDNKDEEEKRRRSGSFRGWVTRKGRKGDKDEEDGAAGTAGGDKDATKEGKESETEDEESVEVSDDWRAIMATKRSVLIILDNLSDETLMRRGAGKLSTGSWGRYPPAVVPPHGVSEFGAYGTTLKGTKGRCIYTIDGIESTFIFQWSNSKVGTPEIRCVQNPKEFKVEVRGRIDRSAEVTFSIFSASGPKPKRPEATPTPDGAHPTQPSDGAPHASPPPFPVFDNLLDDSEVLAVEKFVLSQTASFGSPRSETSTPLSSPPASGGFPQDGTFGLERGSMLPSPQPADAIGRAQPSNPFLDPSNPFADPSAAGSGGTDWAAEDDDDWGEDEPASPATKFKFTIKSKEEITPDDTTPVVFKLSSPPPAASGSKQTRRKGSTLSQEKIATYAQSDSSPHASPGAGGGGGGLVYRHTGPENKGEATTPVTARAARLVQRKTGPSGTGGAGGGSGRLKRRDGDLLSDSKGAPIGRKEKQEQAADVSSPATPPKKKETEVLFEVARSDATPPASPVILHTSPTPARSLPLSVAPPSPATPTSTPTPTPAPKPDVVIGRASNLMLTCGTRMQSGQFREAFLDAENALTLLQSVPDVNMVLKPLKICIDYKLAILILMDIDTLNKHPPQTPEEATLIKQRAAVLAKHLATLRLTPQHAAISVRMAITRNIEAQNYGVASGLLQLVLSRNPPDAAGLNEKFHQCKQMNETNAMPQINNPFCCRTLRLIEQNEKVSGCPVCGSHYAAAAVGAGESCPLCSSAAVVIR